MVVMVVMVVNGLSRKIQYALAILTMSTKEILNWMATSNRTKLLIVLYFGDQTVLCVNTSAAVDTEA